MCNRRPIRECEVVFCYDPNTSSTSNLNPSSEGDVRVSPSPNVPMTSYPSSPSSRMVMASPSPLDRAAGQAGDDEALAQEI